MAITFINKPTSNPFAAAATPDASAVLPSASAPKTTSNAQAVRNDLLPDFKVEMVSLNTLVYQPAIVHGGVPSDEMAPAGVITREREFERFRHDPACAVLLANPAACGEGVSLHYWCHHAVYLDRTFNAGHFLQSQDRIHRLGLAKDVVTRFTLLISAGSIDDSVDGRLAEKVTALSLLMDDPGLVQIALPSADEGSGGTPAFEDDYQAVAAHIAVGNA